MKLSIKQIIYIAIALVLFIWIVISQVKCNNLKKEMNRMKIDNLEQVDSLVYINNEYLKQIKEYQLEVSKLKTGIDSLKQVKNKVIIKKEKVFISKDVSTSVNQLKTNLNK